MISGLRLIDTNLSRTGIGGGGKYEKNIEEYIHGRIEKPYYIFFSKLDVNNPYIKESLELISDDYIVVDNSDIKQDDIIVNNYGEFIQDNPNHLHTDAYFFLRELFLKKLNKGTTNFFGEKIYLRRDRSHLCSGNNKENQIKRRQIINEEELVDYLKKIDIKSIYLEDLSFIDKIKLFNQSDIIISPNSGGLTFSIFCETKTRVVEINVVNPIQISHQYKSQCDVLNIPYYRFDSDKIDQNDNMMVDINKFNFFLENIFKK